MAEFTTEDQVDDLTYDFTKYVKGAKGAIPEPSSLQIETFTLAMEKAFPKDDKGNVDTDQMKRLLGKDGVMTKTLTCIADLCSGKPSLEDMLELPYRAQRAWIGWVVGQFMGEAETPVTAG